jgi:uncharacterized membrane protein YhhN
MMIFPIVAIASLAGLLVGVKNEDQRLKWMFKPMTSLLFVLTGLWLADFSTRYDLLIVVGLVLGLVGDVLLIRKAWFVIGLVAFLLGHILYGAAFMGVLSYGSFDNFNILVLAPILIGRLVFYFLKPYFGKMKGPVTAYFIVITVMMCTAMAVYFEPDAAQTFRRLVVLGALCFYASDLAVALDRFVKPSFKQAFWGLPLYYVGQFLLAYSVAENT